MEGALDSVRFQDRLQELQLVDQRSLSEMPRNGLLNQPFEMLRNEKPKDPQVFLVLSVRLIKAEKAMAFAHEEKNGIDDADALDRERSFDQLFEPSVWNAVNIRHDVDRHLGRAIDDEYANLPVGRGGARNEPPLLFGTKVL